LSSIVIVGSGGFGMHVHQIANDVLTYSQDDKIIGFLDEDSNRHGIEVNGLPVLGGLDWISENENTGIVVAIGDPKTKKKVVEKINKMIDKPLFETLIHPTAWVSDRVRIGEGTIVCAGSYINTGSELGNHVIVNLNTTIGHDVRLKDYVTVAPSVSLAGFVTVEEGADLGINCTIIQGKTVGGWSMVGAGSVVIRDIEPKSKIVGNPTRVIPN